MTGNFTAVWNKCLDILKEKIQDTFYNTYILELKPIDLNEDSFVFEVSQRFFIDTIESKY